MLMASNKIYREMIIILCLSITVSCGRVEPTPQSSDEIIKEHFGDMAFTKVSFETEQEMPANDLSVYEKAQLEVRSGNGDLVGYKWLALADRERSISDLYIGGSHSSGSGEVQISKDDFRDKWGKCSQKDDPEGRDCHFDLLNETIRDCESSSTVADCREACWYNISLCRGG